jgi:hypothetical protein
MPQPPAPPATVRHDDGKVATIVGEFLEERAKEDAVVARQVERHRAKGVALRSVLGMLCVAAWLIPIPHETADPLAEIGPTGRATKAGLDLIALEVQEFTRVHGALPPSLGRVGVRDSVELIPGPRGTFALRTLVGRTTYTRDYAALLAPPAGNSVTPNVSPR